MQARTERCGLQAAHLRLGRPAQLREPLAPAVAHHQDAQLAQRVLKCDSFHTRSVIHFHTRSVIHFHDQRDRKCESLHDQGRAQASSERRAPGRPAGVFIHATEKSTERSDQKQALSSTAASAPSFAGAGRQTWSKNARTKSRAALSIAMRRVGRRSVADAAAETSST